MNAFIKQEEDVIKKVLLQEQVFLEIKNTTMKKMK